MNVSQSYPTSEYNFACCIGAYGVIVPYKVNKTSIKRQVKNTYPTSSYIKKRKYIASKNLIAYKTTTGKTKAFTIKKDSYTHIYALYQNGNKRYIKVKNSAGKYGYVKVGSSMLFKESSCLWWR